MSHCCWCEVNGPWDERSKFQFEEPPKKTTMNFIPEKVADGDDLRTWVDFQWQMEMTGGGNYDKPSLALRLPMKTRHPWVWKTTRTMSHLGYFWWRFLTDFRGSFVGLLELWSFYVLVVPIFLVFPLGLFLPMVFIHQVSPPPGVFFG